MREGLERYWCLKSKRSMNGRVRDEAQKIKNEVTFIDQQHGSLFLSILRNKLGFTILKTSGLVLGILAWLNIPHLQLWLFSHICNLCSTNASIFFCNCNIFYTCGFISHICNFMSHKCNFIYWNLQLNFYVLWFYILQLWLYFSYLRLYVALMWLYFW